MSINGLGTKLQKLRIEKGLSQDALAEILNIDRTTLAGYETGRREPCLMMLCTIADYFNVSVDYLLGRDYY